MPSYTSPPFRIPFTTEITWQVERTITSPMRLSTLQLNSDISDVCPQVHSNNVDSNFIALRAAAELGIKRFCQASSVNAIGLTYSNQPIEFEYFPYVSKMFSHALLGLAKRLLWCHVQGRREGQAEAYRCVRPVETDSRDTG